MRKIVCKTKTNKQKLWGPRACYSDRRNLNPPLEIGGRRRIVRGFQARQLLQRVARGEVCHGSQARKLLLHVATKSDFSSSSSCSVSSRLQC